MTGWNLPDGCEVHHLPGNRPEDEAYDEAFQWAIDEFTYEFEQLIDRIVEQVEDRCELEIDHYDLKAEGLSALGYEKRRKKEKK